MSNTTGAVRFFTKFSDLAGCANTDHQQRTD